MGESFLEAVEEINGIINRCVWGWPTIILILGTGLLLSVRTRFLQVRRFGTMLGSTIVPTIKGLGRRKQKDRNTRSISQFEAFSTALSGTVGTGNIIGVVAAILSGGPGAVLWMWISAFFGMITNYAENVLGLYYRTKDSKGNFSGGVFYSIACGMKRKRPAQLAAVFCIFAAIGMSGVQSNKISGALAETYARVTGSAENTETVRRIIGIVAAGITAIIILGGIRRIGRVASLLVPFMSLLFIALALAAIALHCERIPEAFGLIFAKAFSFRAAGGGILGYAFPNVVKKGMARGVFSNEAGLGSSVIAHAASETREPVQQGLWGIFGIFFDTFVICTLTALMFLTTYDVRTLSPDMDDAALAMSMFSANFGGFGTAVFSVILPLFAFTTIIAWSYYGEKAVEFCFGFLKEKCRRIPVILFKSVYVLLIGGSVMIRSRVIWEIDDTFNGLMAAPNLVCLVALSGTVVQITRNYFDRKKGLDVEPMLSAYPGMNEEFKADICGKGLD